MNKKIVISFIAAITAVIVGILAYQAWYKSTHLVLIESSPRHKEKQVSTFSKIVLTYNRRLSSEGEIDVAIDPYVNGRVEMKDNQITFTPLTSYVFNKDYKFCIHNVSSVDGKHNDKSCITFKTGYKESLSPEELKSSVQQTDTLEVDYPILQHIPYSTLDYKIDYAIRNKERAPSEGETLEDIEAQNRSGGEKEVVIIITLNAIQNRPDQRAEYISQLKLYKTRALEYLKSKGLSIEKAKIEYKPFEATNL